MYVVIPIKFCKRDDNKECQIFFEDPLVMYFKNSVNVIFFLPALTGELFTA